MTWQTPWVISGVSEIPLEVARVLAYVATGGGEGVVSSTDLEIRQMTIAGTSIVTKGGAMACRSRFAGQSNQSYIGQNIGDETTAVPANTGTSTRYDLVYAHVTDPGMPGQPTTALPVQTRIIQGVTNATTSLSQVAGYETVTGLVLARLAIPGSTSTIQQSMITDLRQLVSSRRQTEVRMSQVASGVNAAKAPATYGTFPGGASWSIPVPTWATRMAVIGNVVQLEVRGATTDSMNGSLRISAGTVTIPEADFNLGVTAGSKDITNLIVAGDISIPSAMRGANQTFVFQARKNNGALDLYYVPGSTAVLQVTFYASTTASS